MAVSELRPGRALSSLGVGPHATCGSIFALCAGLAAGASGSNGCVAGGSGGWGVAAGGSGDGLFGRSRGSLRAAPAALRGMAVSELCPGRALSSLRVGLAAGASGRDRSATGGGGGGRGVAAGGSGSVVSVPCAGSLLVRSGALRVTPRCSFAFVWRAPRRNAARAMAPSVRSAMKPIWSAASATSKPSTTRTMMIAVGSETSFIVRRAGSFEGGRAISIRHSKSSVGGGETADNRHPGEKYATATRSVAPPPRPRQRAASLARRRA